MARSRSLSFEILEELLGLAESEIGHLGNVAIGNRDREGDRIEPAAAAGLTGDLRHVLLVVLPSRLTLGRLVTTVEERDGTFEGGLPLSLATEAVGVLDGDLVLTGAVEDLLLDVFGQVLPCGVHREAEHLAETGQQPVVVAHSVRRPHRDHALTERQARVCDHQLGIDLIPGADTGADRARPVWAVEREVAWLQVLEGKTAFRTGEVLRERQSRPVDDLDVSGAIGEGERRLQ